MTTEQIPTFSGWIPEQHEALRIGPPLWNGKTMISDIALVGDERLVEIGLVERFILTAVDGRRSIPEIREHLSEQGLDLAENRVTGVLNKFAFFGAVKRPFAIRSGVEGIDRSASRGPAVRKDQLAGNRRSGGLLTLWRHMGWMGTAAVSMAVFVAGAGALGLLLHTVPKALSLLTEAVWGQWLLALPVALLWTLLVTLLHENSHAAVFNRLAGNGPFLALTRFGIVLMPNTHMPGFSLLRPRDKAHVIAVGPAVSMVCSLMPVTVFLVSGAETLKVVAALCLCLDALIVCLGISFFPNTDATRLVEAGAGVDQIQAVAFRSLMRTYAVPASLSLRSRLAIWIYPVLLLVTCSMWLAVVLWAFQLITS